MKKIHPVRDALLSALVILVTCHLAIWVVVLQAQDELLREIQYFVKSTALTASEFTDKDLFKTITLPEQKKSPEYAQLVEPHLKILKSKTDLHYIYTLVKKDNKIFFVTDVERPKDHMHLNAMHDPAHDNEDQERDTTANVMEEYTEATSALKHAFSMQSLQVEDKPYSDQWGTFISAYSPIFDNDGRFIGVVGVDLDVSAYNNAVMQMWSAFINGSLLACLLATILFYYIYNLRMYRARYQNLRLKFNSQIQGITENLSDSATLIRQRAATIIASISFAARNTNKAQKSINGASLRIEQISIVSSQLANSLTDLRKQSDEYRIFLQDVAIKLEGAQKAVAGLTASNQKINDAMALIPKITSKINMVALNATIEAARAGELGKGFIVVANEVKTLAKQTDEATAKIASCLIESQASAGDTILLIETIDSVVTRVKTLMEMTDQIVYDQSSMLSDINQDITEVAESARLVETIVKDIDGMSHQVKQSTDDLYGDIETFEKQSAGLELKFNNFIHQVENRQTLTYPDSEEEVVKAEESPPLSA